MGLPFTMNRFIQLLVPVIIATIQYTIAENDMAPRIGIIGAGIGGASTAHFLKSLFKNDAVISVYESKQIGGRLATTVLGQHEYELGGSVIHPTNKYMVDFTKLAGLEKRIDKSNGRLGLYDGSDYVFIDSDWQIVTLCKMLWRYGFSFFKWETLMDNTLSQFSKIYELQEKGYAYTTPAKLLNAMSPHFANLTQITIKKHLEAKSFSNSFINEFVMAVTRVNYGQTPDINGFVGEVALAGATPDLWSVTGGNRLVPEKLLKMSGAVIIPETVSEIKFRKEDEKFVVVSSSVDPNNNIPLKREETYDIVIIASPLIDHLSNISFTGFPSPVTNFKGQYHRTVTTLVQGEINKTHLHIPDLELDNILTTTTNIDFNSLSRIFPVNDLKENEEIPKVWKIFSQEPLTDQQLDTIFIERRETHVTDWLAYPHYTPPEELHPFLLHSNLPIFYTSAIEWAASAMEMSCIAGRNAALLAYQFWNKQTDTLDHGEQLPTHSEL